MKSPSCLHYRHIQSTLPVITPESSAEDKEFARLLCDQQWHTCSSGAGGCKDNIDKVCKNGFDGELVPETHFDKKGYPVYKRPTAADLRIVPVNRQILLDWGGHCNVEFCGSTYTALYLYKYLFKGNKKVKVKFNNIDDVDPGNSFFFCPNISY